MWIPLRDAGGKLLARYDPTRGLLEIQRRGIKTTFDLNQHESALSARAGGPPPPAEGACRDERNPSINPPA